MISKVEDGEMFRIGISTVHVHLVCVYLVECIEVYPPIRFEVFLFHTTPNRRKGFSNKGERVNTRLDSVTSPFTLKNHCFRPSSFLYL